MKLIFLDIDGVLNDHTMMPNDYCGIHRECVERFNRILGAAPDAKIVLSSAWRYMILSGDMSLRGFENLLLTHGADCFARLKGHLPHDIGSGDELMRSRLILNWVEEHQPERFVVLDDLALDVPNFVRTDGDLGLQDDDAKRAIEILTR